MAMALMMGFTSLAMAQQINDNNTPLHLMKPAYKLGYGIPAKEDVKRTMDRVLEYIDAETPATLVDKHTGKEVSLTIGVYDSDEVIFSIMGDFYSLRDLGVVSPFKAPCDGAWICCRYDCGK